MPMSRIPEFATIEDLSKLVFAVEAGSAGEEAVEALGYQVNAVQNQAAALMEVKAGTSDAAVVDLLMGCCPRRKPCRGKSSYRPYLR